MSLRPAPSALLVLAVVLIGLAVSACGSSKQSPHDEYIQRLSSACDDMRTKIEKLGKPTDTPIAKIYPQSARIGHAFVKQIAQLDPPSQDEKNAGLMAKQFGYYFDGLALAYAVLVKRESQQGFIQTAQGAVANLHLAEGYARKLGAKACAQEPFG
jgi:hypothetical protein